MRNNNVCIREKADPVQIRHGREILLSNQAAFAQLSAVLSLAGNEVRLKILYLLEEEKELCPCDLSDMLGMSIPAISQHLRKMKDGDIVEFRKAGQTIFYSLKREHLKLLRPFFKIINQLNVKTETV
ncbi:MAG TPA: metalloregulator ArsR/SmtB family transcription factor [Puia sp.]|nr:metalloregulator ArsR/SmtB family transcription factor [Puia sp.]